jgi:hypothetical protein
VRARERDAQMKSYWLGLDLSANDKRKGTTCPVPLEVGKHMTLVDGEAGQVFSPQYSLSHNASISSSNQIKT